jgi:hypothetical protein
VPDVVHHLWRPAAAYVVSRVVVLAAHLAAVSVGPLDGLREAMIRWDAGWYLTIVELGYSREVPTGQSNIAFFPVYPWSAAAIEAVPGVGAADALALVSLAGGLAATCLLWLLVADRYDRPSADRAAALFAFAPGSFVFSMLYSEGLFLALAVAACWALVRQRFVVGGVLCAVASATRPNGLALVAVAAVSAAAAIRHQRRWSALVAPALAPLGFGSYLAFTWHRTGQPDSWFITQREGWGERFDPGGRLEDLRATAEATVGAAPPDWNRIVATLGLVLAALLFWALLRSDPPIELVAYTAVIAALALGSATMGLRPRFVLNAFPLVIGAAVQLRSSFAFSLALAASAGCTVVLAVVTSATFLLTP